MRFLIVCVCGVPLCHIIIIIIFIIIIIIIIIIFFLVRGMCFYQFNHMNMYSRGNKQGAIEA